MIAGFAALAMGGVAVGLELERRLISKRINRTSQAELEGFFALRSAGPAVTTADGVVLHTEVDDVSARGDDPPGTPRASRCHANCSTSTTRPPISRDPMPSNAAGFPVVRKRWLAYRGRS